MSLLTVYGGVLDVTRGKLNVTHAGVNLSDLNWVAAGSGGTARFQSTSISPKTIEDNYTTPDFKCSHYRTLSWSNVGSEDKFITQLGGDTPIIAIVNRDYSDVDTFKASLSGATLVYELATPFDIDLTPEVISAVEGTNNVFADCGQTTVEFVSSNAEDTVDITKSVIEQTNLSDLADIPNPPTTDGNYRLKVTILSGNATYSWEEIT